MIRLLIYAAVAAALVGGTYWFLEGRCNSACKAVKADLEPKIARLEKEKIDAQNETARVARGWAAQGVKTQLLEAQLEGERNARFQPVATAARSLPVADAAVRFPASAASVLNAAVAAANTGTAQPATQPVEEARPVATDTNAASVTQWGVEVAKLYAVCVDTVTQWQSFYLGLQQAQMQNQLH